MAKVVVFSDLHCHPYKPYAELCDDGANSRLLDAVKCVDQVSAYCHDVGVDLVLFAGDLFHTRGRISVSAYNRVHASLERLAGNATVFMIHGNHDQADRAGNEHSIDGLRHVCSVADQAGWVEVVSRNGNRYAILAIPYTEDVPRVRAACRVPFGATDGRTAGFLLGHLGVRGAQLGADFVFSSPYDVSLDDLNLDSFDAVFLGHYHMHQQLAPNCWYVGAALQHTWGDKGQKRGFVVYDTDQRSIQHVELHAPKFVEIENGKYDAPEQSYVKMPDSVAWHPDECERVRRKYNWRSFEVVPVDVSTVQGNGLRLSVDVSMALRDVVSRYVKSGLVVDPELDEDYLLQLGHEILQQVGET